MGNQLSRDYEIGKQVASGGPGNIWRIHSAVKRSNGQTFSAFILEKKQLDPGPEGDVPKKYHEKIYEMLRREVSQLTKLRHPSLLEVVEPLEENRTFMGFVTEPIFASLSNILGDKKNLPSVSEEIDKFELDELETLPLFSIPIDQEFDRKIAITTVMIEIHPPWPSRMKQIQKGILQMAKGISFCHNDAKLIHGNVAPESVYLNAKGDWKISGVPISLPLNVEYDVHAPACSRPHLDFVAPEIVIDKRGSPVSDIYSFGCLIYACFSGGRPPFNHRNFTNFSTNVEPAQIRSLPMSTIPLQMQEILRRMITRDMNRIVSSDLQACKYFDNVLVHTFKFLETLFEKPQAQKIQFLQGITRILPQFPERILLRKILPILLEETKDFSLVPYLIPNLVLICDKMDAREFLTRVAPLFRNLFTVREPVQCLLALLQETDFFLRKVPSTEAKDFFMPLLVNSLDSEFQIIQDRSLKIIPTLLDVLDYTSIKNIIFPKILILDKFTMTEKLIPLLKSTRSKEPAILVAMLGVYDEMGRKYLDKEAIALDIIPELWRCSIDPVLNASQFKKYMKVIKDLSKKVEDQMSAHFDAMKAADDGVKALLPPSSPAPPETTAMDFETLVAGNKGGNNDLKSAPASSAGSASGVTNSAVTAAASGTNQPSQPNGTMNIKQDLHDDDDFEPFLTATSIGNPPMSSSSFGAPAVSSAPVGKVANAALAPSTASVSAGSTSAGKSQPSTGANAQKSIPMMPASTTAAAATPTSTSTLSNASSASTFGAFGAISLGSSTAMPVQSQNKANPPLPSFGASSSAPMAAIPAPPSSTSFASKAQGNQSKDDWTFDDMEFSSFQAHTSTSGATTGAAPTVAFSGGSSSMSSSAFPAFASSAGSSATGIATTAAAGSMSSSVQWPTLGAGAFNSQPSSSPSSAAFPMYSATQVPSFGSNVASASNGSSAGNNFGSSVNGASIGGVGGGGGMSAMGSFVPAVSNNISGAASSSSSSASFYNSSPAIPNAAYASNYNTGGNSMASSGAGGVWDPAAFSSSSFSAASNKPPGEKDRAAVRLKEFDPFL